MPPRSLIGLILTPCVVFLTAANGLTTGGRAVAAEEKGNTPAQEELLEDPEIRGALALINQARQEAGLAEVRLSVDLSAGCAAHARYLVLNHGDPGIAGLRAHKEDVGLKGWSERGGAAGKASVIDYVFPREAVPRWMASLYHRIPLLQPALREVGVAYHRDRHSIASVVDSIRGVLPAPAGDGKAETAVVYYPRDGQKDVPLAFAPEVPSPLPEGFNGTAGFPITAYFAANQKVSGVSVSFTGPDGQAVSSYVSTPEAPATNCPQWNTVCIIPKQALTRGATYRVKLTCRLSGMPFERSWQFRTLTGKSGKKPDTDKRTAKDLADRLVKSFGWEQLLKQYAATSGVEYTEAIAIAIPRLSADARKLAREALAERLSKRKETTLLGYLTDSDAEIRRAAALALGMRDAKETVAEIAKLLLDPEPSVVRAARASLRSLTREDYGPQADATEEQKRESVRKYQAWSGRRR
jgi:hypothetical protein